MIYRLATADDAERLADMRWEYAAREGTREPVEREAFLTAFVLFFQERVGGDWACWVAEDENRIVAHVHIQVVKKLPKAHKLDGKWGYVAAMYAEPEFRNRGIGTRLMEHAIAWSKTSGLEHLLVWPSRRSIPFYERAGFSRENEAMALPL